MTACKNGTKCRGGSRRRVVTIADGVIGKEKALSVACMHCSDAPCMAVCPVDCFYRTDEGVVLHDKDVCIGCGYCSLRLPLRRAAVFPSRKAPSACAARWTSTFCAGGPEEDGSQAEFENTAANRLCRGQAAAVRRMCSTKALLAMTPPKWPTSSRAGGPTQRQRRRHQRLEHRLRQGSMDADMKGAETGGAK